jgi:NitT/TauT family transport system ATP-binding protein
MESPLLRVSELNKSFGESRVLHDVSFELPSGSSLSIIGPSGCGKSTLLSIVAGLTRPSAGQAVLPEDCRTAFILQDYGLFPWKTVRDNLALPLQLRGTGRKERRAAASAMLEELGLEGLGQRFPVQLSGGQRQRVAIGRALISKPDLLLMDEPFAALDAITREHLQNLLLDVWKRHRMSFMLVTHNVAEAVFLGRYIMVMGGSPATKTLWLENPCFGDASSRNSDVYFSLIRQVHEALESGHDSGEGKEVQA